MAWIPSARARSMQTDVAVPFWHCLSCAFCSSKMTPNSQRPRRGDVPVGDGLREHGLVKRIVVPPRSAVHHPFISDG